MSEKIESTQKIVNLKDNRDTKGHFFIGTGYVGTDLLAIKKNVMTLAIESIAMIIFKISEESHAFIIINTIANTMLIINTIDNSILITPFMLLNILIEFVKDTCHTLWVWYQKITSNFLQLFQSRILLCGE